MPCPNLGSSGPASLHPCLDGGVTGPDRASGSSEPALPYSLPILPLPSVQTAHACVLIGAAHASCYASSTKGGSTIQLIEGTTDETESPLGSLTCYDAIPSSLLDAGPRYARFLALALRSCRCMDEGAGNPGATGVPMALGMMRGVKQRGTLLWVVSGCSLCSVLVCSLPLKLRGSTMAYWNAGAGTRRH